MECLIDDAFTADLGEVSSLDREAELEGGKHEEPSTSLTLSMMPVLLTVAVLWRATGLHELATAVAISLCSRWWNCCRERAANRRTRRKEHFRDVANGKTSGSRPKPTRDGPAATPQGQAGQKCQDGEKARVGGTPKEGASSGSRREQPNGKSRQRGALGAPGSHSIAASPQATQIVAGAGATVNVWPSAQNASESSTAPSRRGNDGPRSPRPLHAEAPANLRPRNKRRLLPWLRPKHRPRS